jgi:hypothetical protein
MDRQVSTEENKGCSKKKTLKRKLVFMVVAFVKKKVPNYESV